jgi:hypothetical protein
VSADTAYEGDELVGFVSALFARGTAGLLTSCIPVSDAAVPSGAVQTWLLRGPMAVGLHEAKATTMNLLATPEVSAALGSCLR